MLGLCRSQAISLVLLLLGPMSGLLSPSLAFDASPPGSEQRPVLEVERPLGRVGEIIIIGNEVVPHFIILSKCQVYSGGPFYDSDLRRAERDLARLGIFQVRPTISAVSYPESPYKNVKIEVEEAPHARYVCALLDITLLVSIALTEGLRAALARKAPTGPWVDVA